MEIPETKRILLVLNRMDYGGIEAVVMNYYRSIDRKKIQFDFAVCEDSLLPQKKEIESLGGRLYLFPPISHLTAYLHQLRRFLREQKYQIVHCHMNTLSIFPLMAAWSAGVKVRICHNHTTADKGEGKKTLAKYLLRPFCKWFATDYFSCGKYAGEWMYGKKAVESGKVYIVHNAIDAEQFRYNTITRISMRMKLGLTDKFVIGHVGRFMYQKNHDFLIDIFAEVHRRNGDAVLFLIGEGELEEEIRQKVKELGLTDSVIFYGTSEDTASLYQVMDVFCLPSFYEGLPVVAVEAQMNGLPVISSDQVTDEAMVLESCCQLALAKKSSIWADCILNVDKNEQKRQKAWIRMSERGFAIREEAMRLQEWYGGRTL